jgi:eukaryotic-like serine/threonine-protein kinase
MTCSACGSELPADSTGCAVCDGETSPGTTVTATATERARTLAQPNPGQRRRRLRHGPRLSSGEIVAGRYEVVSLLGRGGMGAVYRARDQVSGLHVAVKVLHAGSDDDEAASRFRREIEILSRVEHPGIVRIFDWGVIGTRMYFAAELIDGEDVRTILRARGRVSPEETAQIGARVADALAAAHALGVVHRDVKPHNVMIRPGGEVTLLDFGVARGFGAGGRSITSAGVTVGTPHYMAPEQFSGKNIDGRSDVYSLGIVLYEMLSGDVPFRAETPKQLAEHHRHTPPAPIRARTPAVSEGLERVVLKCLEKDPEMRYAQASELAAALRAHG